MLDLSEKFGNRDLRGLATIISAKKGRHLSVGNIYIINLPDLEIRCDLRES